MIMHFLRGSLPWLKKDVKKSTNFNKRSNEKDFNQRAM